MKETVVTEYFVRVEPYVYTKKDGQVEAERRECESIILEIKRHVDDVRTAELCCEEENLCSFCGYNWTEDSDTYNGGCCDEDEANNPQGSCVTR